MPRPGWKSINIREDIYWYLKQLVEEYPALGYGTITELVHDAVRRLQVELVDRLGLEPKARMPSVRRPLETRE